MSKDIFLKYEALALDQSRSLPEVCRAAGIAYSTVTRWSHGSKPRGSTMRRLDAELKRGLEQ